jgi:hypothetical protein
VACKTFTSISIFLFLFVRQSYVLATDWKIIPSLTLSGTYSDNINLAPSGNGKGAFVTELSPGISIRGLNGRHRLNLDYRMQNLQNAGGNNKFDIFHQLQLNSNSVLVRNSLFLDLRSTISQQNESSIGRNANDNLSGGRNRTNVITYGVSPAWTPNFNGYVNGVVRFDYDHVSTSGTGLASTTDTFEESVRLNSGRRFSRFTWFVDFVNRDEKRADGDDVKFQNSLAELRGYINRYFSVFTQFGYSNNSFRTTTDENKNGFFYNVGARWRPSARFSLEAAAGNNSFVTVEILPNRRMRWITTYRFNDIGTNTGSVWETGFDFRTKRSFWKASYVEDTTTVQNVLSNIQSFTVIDEFGNPVNDPVTQQPVQSDISLPTLQNQVFIRKRGTVSGAYRTGKSNFFVQFISERRAFQVSQTKDDVIGVNGSWDWRFTRRSAFFIRPSWLQTTRENSFDNRWDVALGLTRTIPVRIGRRGNLNARIEYRYVNQSSDLEINEFIENRITANLLFTY